MRAKAVVAALLVIAGGAQVALAQHRDVPASLAPPPAASDGGESPASFAPPPPAQDAGHVRPADPPAPRDACAEVLHAVQFEDAPGAGRAYAACRARVTAGARIPVADDVRTLEDVTEALHGLRREDGAFCVEPSAPFDLRTLTANAADTRACFAALDHFLSSDNAVWRFAMADPYASGRLAARAGFDMVAARRLRRRPASGTAAERELLAIARLAGRHSMRTCRCLSGPQPDSVTAVRAMHLPSTVESVLLRGLEDRDGAHAEP